MTIKFDLGHDLESRGVRIYQIVTGVTSDFGVPDSSSSVTISCVCTICVKIGPVLVY